MPSSKQFDVNCFLARYPDLRNNTYQAVDSSLHWGHGKTAKDAADMIGAIYGINKIFGAKFYKMPDEAFKFFTEQGGALNLVGGCDLPNTIYDTSFNSTAYLNRYWDIRLNPHWNTNPQLHYEQFGKKELRIPGYELINENTDKTGTFATGTTKFISIQNLSDYQKQQDLQHIQPPAPVLKETSQPGNVAENSGSNNSKNILFFGIGAIALILLLRKKKKAK